jgi:FKBP-type peptidyl-prolyl cis-trans isomerase SlyD
VPGVEPKKTAGRRCAKRAWAFRLERGDGAKQRARTMERQVVSFHYILRNEAGEVIDSSGREHPVSYLEGSGAIIEGLERAIRSFSVGQRRLVSLAPEQAYGLRDEAQVQTVERKALPVSELKIGDMFQAGEDRHAPVVRVIGIEGDAVRLDANHPLAGQRLYFEVQVVNRRPATPDEIDHGHVHGPGGHHH